MTTTARLSGVTRSFGAVTAIRDLSLELRAGQIYGLLGPNGAGKSTTLRTLLGLTQPDKGTVELLGGPPDDGRRARVGFVPEQRALATSSRVRDLMVFFAQMRGWDKPGANKLADDWIGRMELGEKALARVDTLSNGQQQKVQLSLALMIEPEVLLLDEPLTGLDPTHQELVFRHVREAARRGATVLLSTHRLREAQALLDHIFLVSQGEVVLDSPLEAALEAAFDGTWRVRCATTDWIGGPDVASATPHGRDVHVKLAPGASISDLLARAAAAGAPVMAIEAILPTLHDLYLARVGRDPSVDL